MNVKLSDKWWINPFYRFAGWTALLWGLLILVVSTWLAWKGGVVFDSIFSVHFYPVPWQTAFLCHFLNWAVLGLLMYVSARVFSKSRIRLVDALGTMALARAPFLLIGLFMAFPAIRKKLSGLYAVALSGDLSMLASPILIVFLLLTIVAIIWFVCLAYNGFKVFGNVRSPRTIPVFAGTLIVAEILAIILLFNVYRPMMKDSTADVVETAIQKQVLTVEGEEVSPDDVLYTWTEQAAELFCTGRYTDFVALFDDTMKESLSVNQIAALMTGLNATIGKLDRFEKSFIKQKYDAYDLVFVPLVFEKEELTLQLAFDQKGQISGLYVKPPLERK